MPHATRLVTAAELERFPWDDRRYELVRGRLVPVSPVTARHGQVAVQIALLLRLHLQRELKDVFED